MKNDEAFAIVSGAIKQSNQTQTAETLLIEAMRLLQKPNFGQDANEIAARINQLLETK